MAWGHRRPEQCVDVGRDPLEHRRGHGGRGDVLSITVRAVVAPLTAPLPGGCLCRSPRTLLDHPGDALLEGRLAQIRLLLADRHLCRAAGRPCAVRERGFGDLAEQAFSPPSLQGAATVARL